MRRLFITIMILILMTGCTQEPSEGVTTGEIIDDALVTEEAIVEEVNDRLEGASEEEQGKDEEPITYKPQKQEVPVVTPLIFSISRIEDEMAAYMTGKSFHENPHIQISDLRYVQTGYFGFDGEVHQGAIIINEVIAEDVLDIFIDLYEAKYPIEQMVPIDAYDGTDHASMVANNTSGFNYRLVAGTNKLSNHAYGLAIDINPLVNPWVTSSGEVDPLEGAAYADRSLDQQGMIKKNDACYMAFTSRGFSWGGDWKSSKDYQHFDIGLK